MEEITTSQGRPFDEVRGDPGKLLFFQVFCNPELYDLAD
jgi:hypothetical protein